MPTPGDYRVLIVDDDFRVGELHASMVNEIPGFTALEPCRIRARCPRWWPRSSRTWCCWICTCRT
ncbi:hypothetical protein [Arthrobacter sp. JCM 19049]|uniref:hypothetical protein n=1 Tax=Arthrobacter sp. JCM 19049 TaxID=1460643 RepID=UPI0024365B3C|nr:hypothetical protein [Arthrobacter sp. JCM 19049]